MNFIKKHKVFTVVLALIIIIAAAVAITANVYLSKINFDNGTLQTAPSNPDSSEEDEGDILNSGELSAEDSSALSTADASIRANLDDSKIWYSDDVINILLMGIDYGSKTFPYGRSDSMIVLSINKTLKKINLISFSRAAYVSIPGYKNTRLNHAHGYGGPALAIKTIEKNYKIRIDNYVSTTFDSFEKIVDAVGGVKITLTQDEARVMSSSIGSTAAGTYNLNGKQALIYARLREIDTDRDRTGRQRKVLLAIAEKAKTMNASSILNLLNTVLPLVTTDMSKTQLVSQVANAISYLSWEIHQEVIPHKSSDLVLRGGFEVLLIDWTDEVKYVHDLFYSGNSIKYEIAA
ncbi:MAG: LCP family protein [Acutalibacteraceae bacterium]